MAQNLFSAFIFFIVFRETLECSIIISILLGLVDQVVQDERQRFAGGDVIRMVTMDRNRHRGTRVDNAFSEPSSIDETQPGPADSNHTWRRRTIRMLRSQILLGSGMGFMIALCLGAAFIGVWFTEASNLWEKSENLLQGMFQLIASLIIFVMGITMLKMDRAKVTWRIKLQRSIKGEQADRSTRAAKWALFILPLVTVVREGIEAIVFVGGVSFSQTATSIPIAAIVGLVSGLVCGVLIYQFATRTTLSLFLIVMTNFVLLMGAGLFSKGVQSLQDTVFDNLVGLDPDRVGNGVGTFDVRGNVWALDCCNPNDGGWSVFYAVLGWQNAASMGSILSYVFYWSIVIAVLIYMKYKEGRTKIFGKESTASIRRRDFRNTRSQPAPPLSLDAVS
ncbi:iron permease FTR1 [Hygrophoropsis aurantiaca]|uniref:Iron permease FTR1 n=1 Tax=Hygrophoropsis aurantiaca TaxID=72124 RepID=A0ACB8AND0_9AGAM|nr:iron permease FTR1 [Hygrophoropsis aurantiaca]